MSRTGTSGCATAAVPVRWPGGQGPGKSALSHSIRPTTARVSLQASGRADAGHGHDAWRSSGAPELVEQAARLAFKGAGGIAVVGAAAGKQPHDPESGKQPAQSRDLLALTWIEVEAVKAGFSINARVSRTVMCSTKSASSVARSLRPEVSEVHQVHAVCLQSE